MTPALWLPRWFNPLAAFASTGKLQRDPATGKIMRDAASGKAWRGDDAADNCCCGGQPCIFCDMLFVRVQYAFFTGGGDWPIGMFNGVYCLPFQSVGGPAHNRCGFGGICAISYTGAVSGRHYKAMEVSAPQFFRETVGANTGKLIMPSGTSMSINMWDDMNIKYNANGGNVTSNVIATNPGCDEHLIYSNFAFSMDLVKDNGCSGAPLCTGPFCIQASPAACGIP